MYNISFLNFKKLRKEKGLTLRQVEKITSISNSYLSQLENGKIKEPSFSVVIKLLNIYSEFDISEFLIPKNNTRNNSSEESPLTSYEIRQIRELLCKNVKYGNC